MCDNASSSQCGHHQENWLFHLSGDSDSQRCQKDERHIVEDWNRNDKRSDRQCIKGLSFWESAQHGAGDAVRTAIIIQQLSHNDSKADGKTCAFHKSAKSHIDGIYQFHELHSRADAHDNTSNQKTDSRVDLELHDQQQNDSD